MVKIIYQTSSLTVPSFPWEEQPAVERGLREAPGSGRAESGWELERGGARVWITDCVGVEGNAYVPYVYRVCYHRAGQALWPLPRALLVGVIPEAFVGSAIDF